MKRKLVVAVCGFVTALSLSACGSSSSAESGDAKGDTTGPVTLKIGVVPVVNVAPLYLGMSKGFFEDAGLVIEPTVAQTFAANVASVMNGEQQLGFGATVPLLVAVTNGVPLRLVANSDVAGTPPDGDNSGLFVADGSGISSISDLAGKTVAINALSNVHDVAIKSAMVKAGADPDSVKFLEVALPDMVAALKAKRVDAISLGEPFVTAAMGAGFDRLLRPYSDGFPIGTPIASYFASGEWAEQNADVVKAFQDAMDKSTEYALANPDEARAIMKEYTQIPPDALQKVTLGTFSSEIDPGAIAELAALMVTTGTIDSVPDLAPVTGSK